VGRLLYGDILISRIEGKNRKTEIVIRIKTAIRIEKIFKYFLQITINVAASPTTVETIIKPIFSIY
jgi:hypothetical protein